MSSQAAKRCELAGMAAENQEAQTGRVLDMAKENALRSQGTNQQFGMMKYKAIPGGSQIAGTSLPIRKGVEFYDWNRGEHILQKSSDSMNRTTTDTTEVQNQNTQQITDQKIAASTAYQGDINAALENQAGATIAAINLPEAVGHFFPLINRLLLLKALLKLTSFARSLTSSMV